MIRSQETLIRIPGIDQPVSLTLPQPLASLRQEALDRQKRGWGWNAPLSEMTLAEVAAWADHTDQENWQIWRARRFAARLGHLPIELETGEPVVGKPLIRQLTDDERAQQEKDAEPLKSVPAFSGGDTGHFHPNYAKLFELGISGLLEKIAVGRAAFGPDEDEKLAFYDACRIAMEAFEAFTRRVGADCQAKAAEEPDAADDWRELAGICDRIAAGPPQTFHEACQLMFLTYVASWFAEDHVMTCYGRMDRTLRGFYEADIAAGRLTPQEALNIISGMYIQLNRTCPYSLADGVIVGGRDGDGNDVTNDLTYLCLVARWATWLCYPTLAVAWHENTPDELMGFSMEMLSSGINDPAFFNDEVIPAGLQDHGVSTADSHNFMNSTCVEIKTVGNSNIWVATRYHNCCGALLEAMRRQVDGECPPAADLDELQDRIRAILADQVRETAESLDKAWWQREQTGCFPFASCIIDDCLDRGLDHDRGGCRYNWVENSFVGLANLTDSLVAIDDLVFRNGEMTLEEFYAICSDNFADHEPLRQRIVTGLPKYGNDDDRPDAIATAWADTLCEMTESHLIGGHRYVPGFFCHINHAWLGADTGATPDGRLAGLAFADGAGAAQGRDTGGPTASVLSTTKWSHRKALGGLVHNVRFSRPMLETPRNRQAVRTIVETYLRRGGFEIQLNVLSTETLRDAQKNPQEYRDLVVRVAGYSDYFTTLMKELQDEVIARTEFSEM